MLKAIKVWWVRLNLRLIRHDIDESTAERGYALENFDYDLAAALRLHIGRLRAEAAALETRLSNLNLN